jgi:hypothetical protein
MCGGAMHPSQKPRFSLFPRMEDEICDVIFDIQKEKGLETEGMD